MIILRCIYDVCQDELKNIHNSEQQKYSDLQLTINEVECYFKSFKFYSSNYTNGETLKKLIDSGKNEKSIQNSSYLSKYEIIKSWLLKNISDINLFYKNLMKVIFSIISIDESNDEHVLFSQINSTGKKLTAFDLVKNSLFSSIYNDLLLKNSEYESNKNTEKEFDTKLEDFNEIFNVSKKDEILKYFISYKQEKFINNKSDEIYDKFIALSEAKEYTDNSLLLYDELCVFGFIFSFTKDKFSLKHYKFNKSLEFLNDYFGTYATLIIDIFLTILKPEDIDFHNQKINISSENEEIIFKCLKIIEIYIIRRTFCNISSKNYNRFIPSLVRKIRNNLNNNKYNYPNLLYTILYKKPNDFQNIEDDRDIDTSRMPNDSEFASSFLNKEIYSINSKFCKNFLIRIAKFKNNEKTDFSKYSVEHVMPQNLSKWEENGFKLTSEVEQFKHTIGNLTITPKNSNYSNDLYSEKIKKMKDLEAFVLNNYFFDISTEWNVDEIKKRSEHLLNNFVNVIWSFKDYKEVPIKEDSEEDNEKYYLQVVEDINRYRRGKPLSYSKFVTALHNHLILGKSAGYIDREIFEIENNTGELWEVISLFFKIENKRGLMDADKFESFISKNHFKLDNLIKLIEESEENESENY